MAQTVYSITIPVASSPYYQVQTTLDQINYNLHIRWNKRIETWFLDIFDTDQNPILYGIACLTNVPGLIGRFVVQGFMQNGDIMIIDVNGRGKDPNYESFGAETGPFYLSIL